MRNRSSFHLPSFYAAARSEDLASTEMRDLPLEVFDITYLHFHSLLEIGLCTEGRGTCIVEGQEYPFTAGDVEIVFPFQSHLSRSEGDRYSKWVWLNIDPLGLFGACGAPGLGRLEQLLYSRMGLCGIIDREKYPFIVQLLRRIALPGERNRRMSCLYTLIEELAWVSEGLPSLALRPGQRFLRLEPAFERVQEALRQGVSPTVEELGEICALSPASLRRAFHEVLGQAPQQYILSCQMNRAQQLLLLTDTPITQIALSVGYSDVSGFNRQFLRIYEMSPRQYRNAYAFTRTAENAGKRSAPVQAGTD